MTTPADAAGLTTLATAAAPQRSPTGMVKAEPSGANHLKRRLWQAEQWQREHAASQAALVERLQHLCQNTKNLDGEALSAELLRAVATYNRETADWCTTCGPSDDPFAFTRAQCTTCVATKRRPTGHEARHHPCRREPEEEVRGLRALVREAGVLGACGRAQDALVQPVREDQPPGQR